MMGGTCSLQRQRALWRRNNRRADGHPGTNGSRDRCDSNGSSSSSDGGRSAVRHSVDTEVPDGSISTLYPVDDNYVTHFQPHPPNNNPHRRHNQQVIVRSPKSLVDLCTDAVCRHLPDLDGALPPGLPQDLVDLIVKSLISHAALNATTLRALRHCELGELNLAGCRGVRDEWLMPLSSSPPVASTGVQLHPHHDVAAGTSASFDSAEDGMMDFDLAAASPSQEHVHGPPSSDRHHQEHGQRHHQQQSSDSNGVCDKVEGLLARALLRSARDDHGQEGGEAEENASTCSTATFVSASSTPFVGNGEAMTMTSTTSTTTSENGAATGTDGAAITAPTIPGRRGCNSTTSSSSSSRNHNHVEVHRNATHHPHGPSPYLHESFENDLPNEKDPATGSPPSPPSSPPHHRPMLRRMPSIASQHITLLDLRGSNRLTDRGLKQLCGGLSNLEVAKLDQCHSLVGSGLVALSKSYRLHTVSLANCRRLTDEAIVNLSHLTSLTALSVDGCRCLTDRTLEGLSGLFRLTKLDLSQCDLITDDGLEYLHELNLLEELSLGWCRHITDAGVDCVTNQPNRSEALKVLRLARCNVTDAGVDYVGKRLKNLEEWDLNGCSKVGSAALGHSLSRLGSLTTLDVSYCPGIIRSSWQGKIKNLRSLELCYSGVRDAHLSRLRDLPTLEELNLDSCPVGDWSLAHLADNDVVPNLTSLDLADTDITDLGCAHLPKFTNLTKLSLFYCNITNAGLRHLSSMTTLEVLNLDSREIGDDGLSYLQKLRLKSLDIFSGRITDNGCAHISKIISLESLELCGGGVGDVGCAHLANLENLTCLNLSQNERITNRGAASLATLSQLKALNLSNTRVNSSALKFFSGLLRLQSLALYGCKGIEDPSTLSTLQSELPSLKCLRLNSTSEDDGIFQSHGDANDDEEDEEDGDLFGEEDESDAAAHRDIDVRSHDSMIQDEDFADAESDDEDGIRLLDDMDVAESEEDDELSFLSEESRDGAGSDHESIYSDHD